MERRWPTLTIIATFFKVLGGIAAALTIAAIVGVFRAGALVSSLIAQISQTGAVANTTLPTIILALIVLLYGALWTAALWGAGQLIILLIAVEENSRASALWLQRQFDTLLQENKPQEPLSYS